MKRLFLLLLIVLAGGAWIGQKMVQDPGYVLLSYDQTTVETSLWVMLLGLFCAFLLLHWLVNLFFAVRLPTGMITNWRANRKQKQAQGKTLKGLIALSEGRWWKAQRLLSQAAEKSDQPLVNYLAAARAAHEQGEESAADSLLQQARDKVPQAELAIGITQAQIQFERGQLEPCLATLMRLRRMAPQHSLILRLLKDVYLRLPDWQSLATLLVDLKKQKAISADELASIEQRTYAELLGNSLKLLPSETEDDKRLSTLDREWKNLPSPISTSSVMIKHYVELLNQLGATEKAEQFLVTKIKKNWDEELVKLYGKIKITQTHKQLEEAQGWLKKHPDSPGLQLTLARLAMRSERWQEAADHLERSLTIEESAEATRELAHVLQNLGEHEKAIKLLNDSSSLPNNDISAEKLPA